MTEIAPITSEVIKNLFGLPEDTVVTAVRPVKYEVTLEYGSSPRIRTTRFVEMTP